MPGADRFAELLLEQTPGCQWIVSAPGIFQRFYGDPAPLFGKSAPEMVGRAPADVLEPDQAAAWAGRFSRALGGDAVLLRERRGKEAWYVTVFPVRLEGKICYAGGQAREITPWSNAEQELRHTVLGALKAQQFERAMVSKFLHDSVGQNLTALGLQLDLIRMDIEALSPETGVRALEVQKLLEVMMESVREYSYELNPSTVERAGLRPALDRLVRPHPRAISRQHPAECRPVPEDRSQTGQRDVPDCAGGRGERGSTFQLLHDRNRGKVHTYWDHDGSA